mmetsp:Transcript_14859/g.19510  ORF Transcript_14859/g.19510 Transcript_14859/m.19510 type:complete len:557 (+) Transcript_14859:138-1808(+)
MGSAASAVKNRKQSNKDEALHPELVKIHSTVGAHKFPFDTRRGSVVLQEVQKMREELRKLENITTYGSGLCCVPPKTRPPLDPGFRPFILGKQSYMKAVERCPDHEIFEFALIRQNNLCGRCSIPVFPEGNPNIEDSKVYVSTVVKFWLWQRGGYKLYVCGSDSLCTYLKNAFNATGKFHFDILTMEKIYNNPFQVIIVDTASDMPAEKEEAEVMNTVADGCRLAFDLGKSDFKIVAVQDGEVVFSKETEWDIWKKDPDYHYEIVLEVLKEAASKLPRVDGLGGSTAGTPINNDCVWSDCFPDIEPDLYKAKVVPIFKRWAEALGDVPLKVINDGEVTALAGMQMVGKGGLFGISMGSNEGAGYVDRNGALKGWINELWAGTVDMNPTAAICPWSGAVGNGSMYFGQRAVEKLCTVAGFTFDEDMLPQHKLKIVQKAMKEGDINARLIYESIGVYLGYALAQYAEFYEFDHVLILGRVSSGEGGQVMLDKAKEVIENEFPELNLQYHSPDEHMKRVGQCVAAAALPKTTGSVQVTQNGAKADIQVEEIQEVDVTAH